MTDEPRTEIFAAAVSAFLERCADYCQRKRMSEARLSTLLFNHGARLEQIRQRGNAGTNALDRAITALTALESALAESQVSS